MPDPLDGITGEIIEDTTIPARGSWSRRVARGRTLRIIDLEGCQAVDFLCYDADDPDERYAAADTMKINETGIFLTTGTVLYGVGLRSLFTITADTCGKHDTIGGCCSAELNAFRYGAGPGPNCRDNFLTELDKYGMGNNDMAANINFFMFVPVGAEDRFTAIRDGTIDLLCGATTATLSRRELVDFSLPTFIDGASVLYLKDGPADFEGLAGHKVGVRGGTTTEEALRNSLKKIGVDAQVVSVTDHKEGLRSLEAGEFSAYFADQGILLFLMLQSQSPDMLRLSGRFFTREPYALALPRGDSAFRLLVDRTLSRLYRTGKVRDYFSNAFGSAKPSKLLEALFVVSALPE